MCTMWSIWVHSRLISIEHARLSVGRALRVWAAHACGLRRWVAGGGARDARGHDVAQPLSDRSIRKSPSFLQT
eukprot:7211600-Prymnesium_polylepis.3